MASKPANPYLRLPGTGYRRIAPGWVILLLFFVIGIFALLLRGRRVQLWRGGEHLLLVEWDGTREYYKRFRYQDIQALIIRPTAEGRIVNAVLAFIILVFGALALAVNDSVGTSFLLGIAGIFVMGVIVNVAYGPTCKCQLRTAVQIDDLPSLDRLRRARKVLNRIRPLIEAAQGRLSAEEIASHLANPHIQSAPPVIGRYKAAPVSVPPRYYSGTAHLVLFWLLLVDVPVTAVSIFYDSTWMDLASALLLLVTVVYAIASLVKQHNTTLPAALKRLPWMVLGWAGLMVVTAIVYGVIMVINNPEALDRSLSPLEDPAVLVMTVISTTGTAALGFVGLVLLRKFRASNLAPASRPPVADDQSAV